MSLIVRRWNWLIILLMAVASGCRMGSPLDRNVQISQHLSGEDSSEPPPRTRLAASSASPLRDSAESIRHSLSDSDPTSASSQPRVAAQKTAPTPSSDRAATAYSLTATAGADADLDADVDFSELISAFRDSPPEVQQQAIRQLIAAASHRASQTEQPIDISEQLERSLSALPILPDDLQDSDSLPIRLAATSTSAASQQVSDAGVSQAVVASADPQPAVAPVSSLMPNPTSDASNLPESAGLPRTNPLEAQLATMPADGEKDKLENAGDAALYDELVARLRAPQAGESDGDRFRREIIKRYLQVLAGDPDSAVQSLEGLSAPEQEFLRHHLLALWNMTDSDGHPVTSRRFAAALPQFRLATRHLSEATEQLDVRSLAFCTEILSFGQVKRFTSDRFEAGQKVILYCEVDNFVAEKISEGYETELQGSYEIYDANGSKVAGQVLPSDRQVCNHYLRDYFIAYQMHLPSQLEPGNYRLELAMECVKGHKYGKGTLPLVIKQ